MRRQYRPDPEKLLLRVKEEEQKAQRGKLKIYLGAAPGVGKTYTMLQDALEKRNQGLDVVAGIVESHGRQEIESLLKNFEVIERKTIHYHARKLLEFDLDETLKRNPGLILIDEMAHTNAPGLRHPKRWQDIKEILDRGIDVYTTLNIQHIESLNDVVSQIIQIHITETIPDIALELADTIELIDLPPEDLLKRLQEGKVYIPEQIELAKENFFRSANLTALRELALRVTAERVEAQVILHRQIAGIKQIWPTKDKILVCVGSGSETVNLIRTAKRMATSLHADFVALYVDSPRIELTNEEYNEAIKNLRFAEKLGAETKIITGFDIAKEILNFSREQNVTQIIIWKKIHSRLRDLFRRNLADEIVRHSGEIDVHIVTPNLDDRSQRQSSKKNFLPKISLWRIYLIAIGTVVLITLLNYFLKSYIAVGNLIIVYLLGVIIVSLFGRIGPIILASLFGILAYDFFFISPQYKLAITKPQYFFALMLMFIIIIIVAQLTIFTRYQLFSAKHAEHYLTTLHNLSRQFVSVRGLNNLLNTAARYLGETFNCKIMILLFENGHLKIKANYKELSKLSMKELSIAQWVYDLGQMAGLGTDTLSFSHSLYLPLLTTHGTIGVLRLHPIEKNYLFDPEKMHLLESCSNLIAIALEVEQLEEQAKMVALEKAVSRIRKEILKKQIDDLHKK